METRIQNPADQSATALMGGIIEDVQRLVKQQMALTRQEITEDLRKAKEATVFYAFGGGVAIMAAVSLCFAAAHLLHWAASPAGTDPASIPLWACHAAVGAFLAVVAACLLWSGETRWKSIDPLHNPAADELKKNVEWGLHPK